MSSVQRDNATETQELFNALAEPTRRGIIELLATKGQLSATGICDNFDVSRPAISQHLKVLRKANFVRVEKREPRSGGMWRYVHKDKDGNEYGFHGVIHEVLPPERIIDTFEFEGMPEKGHVALQTLRLQELPGGRTKLTAQAVFQSVADRD